jgi:hypothetical protein
MLAICIPRRNGSGLGSSFHSPGAPTHEWGRPTWFAEYLGAIWKQTQFPS